MTEGTPSTSAWGADLTVQDQPQSSVQMVMAFISRNRMLVAGLVMTVVILLAGIFAPLITPYDPIAHAPAERLLPPGSPNHFLGTDQYGRDEFTRLIYAIRIDLMIIGFLGVLFPFIIGIVLGSLAGYFGGWIDAIIMRVLDTVTAFPYLILLIAIVAVLGPSIRNLIIALTLSGWTSFARLVRGEILVIREMEFIEAARSLGYTYTRILWRHMLPNVITPALVFSMSDIVLTILFAASLSYLGLGVRPPTPEWGAMINEGQVFLRQSWWLVTLPGFACVITGLALSLIGDGLADLLRPGSI